MSNRTHSTLILPRLRSYHNPSSRKENAFYLQSGNNIAMTKEFSLIVRRLLRKHAQWHPCFLRQHDFFHHLIHARATDSIRNGDRASRPSRFDFTSRTDHRWVIVEVRIRANNRLTVPLLHLKQRWCFRSREEERRQES